MSNSHNNIVYKRTHKGEALKVLVRLVMKYDAASNEKFRIRIRAKIVEENEKFRRRFNEDGLALIQKVFGE